MEKLILKCKMNRLSEGYKQAVDQNWGHMTKIGFLGKKKRNFWQIKNTRFLSRDTMFRKKLCKEKVPFSKTNISLLANFGCFFGGEKRIFGPKKHSSAKRKIGCFSVISARTGSVVIVGHFFDGWDGSTKFRCRQSKIKGTYYSEEGMACNGQKQG